MPTTAEQEPEIEVGDDPESEGLFDDAELAMVAKARDHLDEWGAGADLVDVMVMMPAPLKKGGSPDWEQVWHGQIVGVRGMLECLVAGIDRLLSVHDMRYGAEARELSATGTIPQNLDRKEIATAPTAGHDGAAPERDSVPADLDMHEIGTARNKYAIDLPGLDHCHLLLSVNSQGIGEAEQEALRRVVLGPMGTIERLAVEVDALARRFNLPGLADLMTESGDAASEAPRNNGDSAEPATDVTEPHS